MHNRGSEAPCGRGASVETDPYPRYPLLYIRYIITVLYEHGREGPDQRPLSARTKTRLPRYPSTGRPRYDAALVAATAPSAAAVTICLSALLLTSPATKSPGVTVAMRSSVTT